VQAKLFPRHVNRPLALRHHHPIKTALSRQEDENRDGVGAREVHGIDNREDPVDTGITGSEGQEPQSLPVSVPCGRHKIANEGAHQVRPGCHLLEHGCANMETTLDEPYAYHTLAARLRSGNEVMLVASGQHPVIRDF
jgi:hypothetical protein